MKVESITLRGISPIVSGFLNKFDDQDVIIDIVKDKSKGKSEEYDIEIKYNELKLKDPITLIQKSLPKGVEMQSIKSHSSTYEEYTPELDMLRKSVPNIASYDYYIDLDEVLGEDLRSAIYMAQDIEVESSEIMITAFLELMYSIFKDNPKYDSFTPMNSRNVSDLYLRACQVCRDDRIKRLMTIYKIAFDACFESVQKSKVILSTKSQSEFGLNLSRLVSQNSFEDEERLRNYIKKKLDGKLSEIPSGNYTLDNRLKEFPKSKKFYDEVIKVLDDVSSLSHERITTLYLDALRESSGISEPVETCVDVSWDSYKSFINAKDQSK